jgi:hypothetical protein
MTTVPRHGQVNSAVDTTAKAEEKFGNIFHFISWTCKFAVVLAFQVRE